MPPLRPGELMFGLVAGGVTRGLAGRGRRDARHAAVRAAGAAASGPDRLSMRVGGSLMLALLGLLGGIWAEKFDQMAALTNFVITPLSFLSGTFYSIAQLPEPFHAIAAAQSVLLPDRRLPLRLHRPCRRLAAAGRPGGDRGRCRALAPGAPPARPRLPAQGVSVSSSDQQVDRARNRRPCGTAWRCRQLVVRDHVVQPLEAGGRALGDDVDHVLGAHLAIAQHDLVRRRQALRLVGAERLRPRRRCSASTRASTRRRGSPGRRRSSRPDTSGAQRRRAA